MYSWTFSLKILLSASIFDFCFVFMREKFLIYKNVTFIKVWDNLFCFILCRNICFDLFRIYYVPNMLLERTYYVENLYHINWPLKVKNNLFQSAFKQVPQIVTSNLKKSCLGLLYLFLGLYFFNDRSKDYNKFLRSYVWILKLQSRYNYHSM